ncbi:MAG: hypothetical protein D6706_18425 [Chloroflexi bacterium]|nr:MAG: hypothetical protein D6706_18425 [Chloroflexota bacterium]
MIRYVCAMCPGLDLPAHIRYRLYAYPRTPEHIEFTILDSGAFGLSRAGSRIGVKHMHKLAAYYEQYVGEGVCCVAPDVYLDPSQTMRNWDWWQKHMGVPVAPVIQFRKERQIDLYVALRQARYYAHWEPDIVFISNPGLRAIESSEIAVVCRVIRQVTGARWLHNLGAGWDPADIIAWREMGCFDSIDSIAYYTDAQSGWAWRMDGKRTLCKREWLDIARDNAQVANVLATNMKGGKTC